MFADHPLPDAVTTGSGLAILATLVGLIVRWVLLSERHVLQPALDRLDALEADNRALRDHVERLIVAERRCEEELAGLRRQLVEAGITPIVGGRRRYDLPGARRGQEDDDEP